jgi:hypothetical protein
VITNRYNHDRRPRTAARTGAQPLCCDNRASHAVPTSQGACRPANALLTAAVVMGTAISGCVVREVHHHQPEATYSTSLPPQRHDSRPQHHVPVVAGDEPEPVEVDSYPPEPLDEPIPARPATGYVWLDGYWHWDGYQWLWIPGRWTYERHGYVYVEPHYAFRGDQYMYVHSYWCPRPLVAAAVVVLHDTEPWRPLRGYRQPRPGYWTPPPRRARVRHVVAPRPRPPRVLVPSATGTGHRVRPISTGRRPLRGAVGPVRTGPSTPHATVPRPSTAPPARGLPPGQDELTPRTFARPRAVMPDQRSQPIIPRSSASAPAGSPAEPRAVVVDPRGGRIVPPRAPRQQPGRSAPAPATRIVPHGGNARPFISPGHPAAGRPVPAGPRAIPRPVPSAPAVPFAPQQRTEPAGARPTVPAAVPAGRPTVPRAQPSRARPQPGQAVPRGPAPRHPRAVWPARTPR